MTCASRRDTCFRHVTSFTPRVQLTARRIEPHRFGRRIRFSCATGERALDGRRLLEIIIIICPRNVLSKAKELGLQTIGLCSITCSKSNFPSDLGAHVALSKARPSSSHPSARTNSNFSCFRNHPEISRGESPRNRHFVLGAAGMRNI